MGGLLVTSRLIPCHWNGDQLLVRAHVIQIEAPSLTGSSHQYGKRMTLESPTICIVLMEGPRIMMPIPNLVSSLTMTVSLD